MWWWNVATSIWEVGDGEVKIVPFVIKLSSFPLMSMFNKIRYATVCFAYDQLLSRGMLLTNKLLLQGFQKSVWRQHFAIFNQYCPYNLSLSQKLSTMFPDNVNLILTTDHSLYPIYYIGTRRVWPVNRGCLLFLCALSDLWYIKGSVFVVHSFYVYIYFFFLDYEIVNTIFNHRKIVAISFSFRFYIALYQQYKNFMFIFTWKS